MKKYRLDPNVLKELQKKGWYTLFHNQIYYTQWLLKKIKLFLLDDIRSNGRMYQFFTEKKKPYYLLYHGVFYINMKRILTNFKKENQEYSIPFLIAFTKIHFKLKLENRKNIYDKATKENLMLSIVDTKTVKNSKFFQFLIYKVFEIQTKKAKEINNKNKTDEEKNFIDYVANEIEHHTHDEWVWSNINLLNNQNKKW